MNNPNLWYLFAVLFVAAGLMNLARGLRRTDARRPVNLLLGVAGFFWAAAALLYRFVGIGAGYVAGAAAMGIMLAGAVIGMRNSTGPAD